MLTDFLRDEYRSIKEFALSSYAQTANILNAESRGALTDVLSRNICGWAEDARCPFISSEYFGNNYVAGKSYTKFNRMVRHEDLRHTSFPDNHLDLIMST
jgi:hypothetical protein